MNNSIPKSDRKPNANDLERFAIYHIRLGF